MTKIRDDLTVQEISITSPGAANAVPISLPTRYNIFLVTFPATAGSSEYFVKLPDDANSAVGDWVEFHVVNRPFDYQTYDSLAAVDSDGNDPYPTGAPLGGIATYAKPTTWTGALRKVGPNTWRRVI